MIEIKEIIKGDTPKEVKVTEFEDRKEAESYLTKRAGWAVNWLGSKSREKPIIEHKTKDLSQYVIKIRVRGFGWKGIMRELNY